MGSTQALLLPKEFKIELPSGARAVSMRKLTARDQVLASTQFDKEKDDRYPMELIRLVTLEPKSVSEQSPCGVPAFSKEDVLDLQIEDVNYLTAAMTELNKMKDTPKYQFDF
jgi:hypothetical protein